MMKNRFFRITRIIITSLVIVYLCLALYVASFTHASATKDSDIALVLGAKSYKNATYNPCLVSRVNSAVTLYTNKHSKQLIFSGGNDTEDNTNEAQTMKKIAREKGVSEKDIILEKKATSTYENILFSKQLMRSNESIIIITEPFHIARAHLVASSLYVDHTLQAADSPCWNKWKFASRYFLKEPIAILSYILTGKIKLTAFFHA